MYKCGIGDCQRTFVRLDLCNRHKDRHTAKGSALNRKDSLLGQVSPSADGRSPFAPAGSTSPELNRPDTGYGKGRPLTMQYQSPKEAAAMATGSPFTPMTMTTNTPPASYTNGGVDYTHQHHDGPGGGGNNNNANNTNYHHHLPSQTQRPSIHSPPGPQRPTVQTNVAPYGVLSPVSTHPGFHSQAGNTPQAAPAMAFGPSQTFPAFSLPPSDFVSSSPAVVSRPEQQQPFVPSTSAEYSDHNHHQQHHQASDLMLLDQISMQQTMPVFGTEGGLNKSPYVGMPNDFIAYLFQGNVSPMMPLQNGTFK